MPNWKHNFAPEKSPVYPAHYYPGKQSPLWPISYTKQGVVFTSGVLLERSNVQRWNAPPSKQVSLSALNSRGEPSPNVCLGVPLTEVRKLAQTMLKFADDNNLP